MVVVTKLPAQRAAVEEERHDWWRSAACQEADPEMFFPVASIGPGAGEIAQAKAVCAACWVRRQCLQYALATHQAHGVWGGMDEEERQVHVRREREHGQHEHGQHEHGQHEHGQRQHRDPVRPERAEPGGNGGRTRGSRIRSV
jgi:WhiB family redox-sensing transcriptional regulator